MKIISKTLKFLPLIAMVFAFSACSSDDDNNTSNNPQQQLPNIVETAQATPALSSLVDALGSASGNLAGLLSGDGPFTVLAPTNDAFQALLDSNPAWNTVDDIDDDLLAQVLSYHVIEGEVRAADLVALTGASQRAYANTEALTPGGAKISLLVDTSGALPRFNNAANVASADLADIETSNGVVHVIDAVLLVPTIVDHAINNDNFSTLTTALTDEGLVPTLQGGGPFTVFAPTNDAFNAFTNPSGNALGDILLNHVTDAAALSTGLSTGYDNTSLATNADGDRLSWYIDLTEGAKVNGINIVATDIVGSNGVIHVVEEVIDLPTIVTFATTNADFSTLVAALTDLTPTDYVSVLSTSGASPAPFTVFAPVNSAFDALLSDLGLASATDIPTATLEATLNLHVLTDQNVRAEDLMMIDGAMVPTFGGPSITIDAGTPAIIDPDGGSNPIAVVNVQAVNGVIHGITRVIRDL